MDTLVVRSNIPNHSNGESFLFFAQVVFSKLPEQNLMETVQRGVGISYSQILAH